MEVPSNMFYFSKMEIAAVLQIWNRAAISILDIRHNLIARGEAVRQYRLPASTFLFTCGRAELSLNDTRYQVDRFGLFHGGKGTELSMDPQDNWLEYYLIFYKYGEPTFHRREYHTLLVERNPFRQQYGFSPANPLLFVDQLKKLFERWKEPTSLNQFYAKGAFYAFVYEVYAELENGNVQISEPDMIAMAARYLDEHYREDISIQELCVMLGISYSHFHRGFKQKLGSSPKEYLINNRLEAAKGWMESSGAPLREIAVRCGLGDEQGLYRLFKNKAGVSPSVYRENLYTRMRDGALQNNDPAPYNRVSQVSLDELKGKGDRYMFKQMRSKAVMAAALSLMLLLSTCGTAPATTSVTGSTAISTVTSQVTETETAETVDEGTRIVSTSLGDVEVPAKPQRVAVQYLMGDVVALGITPVGISDVYDGAAFSEIVTASVGLGHQSSWDAEEVMALEPDLILVITQDDFNKFSKIASTVLVPIDGMTQAERLTFMGEVLNKQEEAAAAIEAYNTTLEEAKANLAEAGFGNQTISVIEGGFSEMVVMGNKYGTGAIIYAELGLIAPEAVQINIIDKDTYNELVSFEVLPEYSGDYIIRNSYEGMDDLSQSDIWNALPAVTNNRVIEIEFGLSFYTDIYSSIAQINYVTEALINAIG